VIDPVLETTLPDELAFLGKHHRGSRSGAKVAVLAQVYDNVQAQIFLAEVCRRLAEQAGLRVLAVEGTDGPIDSGGAAAAAPLELAGDARERLRPRVAELIASGSQVSAGAIALYRSRPDHFELWGVDAMELVASSQTAMVHVVTSRERRERVFARVREVLRRAQRACYSTDLADLRFGTLAIAEKTGSLSDQMARIRAEADRLGVDLSAFPWVERFDEIRRQEGQLSTRRIEGQRKEFVERAMKALYSWFRVAAPGHLVIDRGKLQPVLEFWFEKTGMVRSELDRRVATEGWEPALLELKAWIEGWLAASAQRAGSGAHVFYEELMRLALRLGVDFFDLRDFRRSVAMSRDMETLKRALPDEMAAVIRKLAEGSGSERGAELYEVEERLDWLCRALYLEVPADDAELAGLNEGALLEVVEELGRLGGTPIGADLRTSIAGIEDVLASARQYLSQSWERARHMAERTLELLVELGEDRAVLIAGGFHTRGISQAFEEDPELSWVVLYPKPDLSEVGGRRHYFG
jgi:hypothetical protein